MNLTDITRAAGPHRRRKRVGRGESSGHGKTSGRGHKGAKARTGRPAHPFHAGGQLPLFRKLPKRGFSNARFATPYNIVNLADLERHFEPDTQVTPELLDAAGLIRHSRWPVKILGDGKLTRRLTVCAHKFSAKAVEKIQAAGGQVQTLPLTAPRG